MGDDKFVVFSMKEKKAKEIAKVISSKKAKAILDLLAEKRSSPNEIAKQLGMPLPTVKYNLDLLKESGLIRATGYKYSEKGREILYYEPARKAIVIAPESSKKNIIQMLGDKVILPIIAAASVTIGALNQFVSATEPRMMQLSAAAAPAFDKAAGESAGATAGIAVPLEPSLLQVYQPFILGTVLALAILLGLYFTYSFLKK